MSSLIFQYSLPPVLSHCLHPILSQTPRLRCMLLGNIFHVAGNNPPKGIISASSMARPRGCSEIIYRLLIHKHRMRDALSPMTAIAFIQKLVNSSEITLIAERLGDIYHNRVTTSTHRANANFVPEGYKHIIDVRPIALDTDAGPTQWTATHAQAAHRTYGLDTRDTYFRCRQNVCAAAWKGRKG